MIVFSFSKKECEALALQMQGASTLYGVDLQQQADASTQALNAALRQQQYGAPRFRQLA